MPQLWVTADRGPVGPPHANIDKNEDREFRDTDGDIDEASDIQGHRLWAPEPEPYDAIKYRAWGRKHYGDDWYEQRETMLKDRNFLRLKWDDFTYVERQKALREMEHEREHGRLPPRERTPWLKLQAWSRTHYGEAWRKQWENYDWDKQEEAEALEATEKKKEALRASSDAVSSPSSSSRHSDPSGPNTSPPIPADQAQKEEEYWNLFEWRAVQSRLSEAQYEKGKAEALARIRSENEDGECERRKASGRERGGVTSN